MTTATKRHAQTARTGNFAGALAELLSTLSSEAVLEEAAHTATRCPPGRAVVVHVVGGPGVVAGMKNLDLS